MLELPKTPQPIANILELGMRLFRLSFRTVLPLTLLIAVISVLPPLLIPNLHSENLTLRSEAIAHFLSLFPLQLGLLVWLYAAIFWQQIGMVTHQAMDSRQALMRVIPKIVALYLACWIYTFIVGLGFVVIILGIVFAVSMPFFMLFILLEKAGIFESIRESHLLVWGYWWHSAAVLILPLLIMILSGLTAAGVVEFLLTNEDTSAEEVLLLGQVVYNFVTSLLTPLMEATLLVLFHDLKLRQKGASPLGSGTAEQSQTFLA